MATIKDVAKAAGVSTATVSYVLNRTKPVTPEIEQRVLEAVKALDYRPQANARNLRKQENRIIGYELPSYVAGDMGTMMHQFTYLLALAADRAGYHLMTFAQEPERSIVDTYQRLILSQRVDGFIVSHTYLDDPRIPLLLESSVPFAAFGRSNAELEFPYVDVDGYDGMVQVAHHLLAQGHERFAFVGWPEGSMSGDARYAGLRDTLAEAGIPIPPAFDRRICNCVDEGYAVATTLMAYAHAPTAIVCVSDVIAIGVVRSLIEHGYHVGRDVAVTGFDDISLAKYLTPPLTSVHQPIEEIGEMLIAMLLTHIQKQAIDLHEQQILLKPQLVIRDSTAAFNGS